MKLVQTKIALRESRAELSGSVALVMTMGALHAGHLSLVKAAKAAADHVIVSIFVNPLQFAPNEDFAAYPRTLDADLSLLAPEGVDLVYAPDEADVYPRTPLVRIDPGPVAKILEGKTRPTHFAGVLQIVHKVFQLTTPDLAFFGQKDAQQLALIRTMVADLDLPLEICAVPIKREADGLAMSSRNSYLSPQERVDALALSRSLAAGAVEAAAGGQVQQVLQAVQSELAASAGVRRDYVQIVDPQTFLDLPADYCGQALIVIAAWIGNTRLIDNREVQIG
ncbi:pantoate--beta-alanine ligase [Arcanobacterium hippocoleae]|uniref:Pantothenate synthetase n=1 Tax=Arcanobacterium hippocoleae TaxID=149017 RepID=A0ABU1T3S5_9ACTO|nr:pantoate--beta-alanine ligase [Arcanobacterium hippocoleae]MDR6939875.1 pantoate--beta-alanine ligase [Arcanobacterium hippocoleae]